MKLSGMLLWIVVMLAVAPASAAADAGSATAGGGDGAAPRAFMRIYGQSLPPHGFVMFCEMNPRECRSRSVKHQRIDLTAKRLRQLDRINQLVNSSIKPETDNEIYGVNEYWTLPVDKGDCEDFALLKRRMLMSRGWPGSALLLTVVRDEKGDGHAVLTIRTAQGDFIADNKNDNILAWHQTPYRYVMRQSYLNPNIWMRLDFAAQEHPSQLAGTHRQSAVGVSAQKGN